MERTAHEGRILDDTKTTHDTGAGRSVPVSPALAAMLKAVPPRIDTSLLFPTSTGRLWRERNFRRDVWAPTVDATGLNIRPHEMRHSFISLMRAAGTDPADLAEITGHSVETMHAPRTPSRSQGFRRQNGLVSVREVKVSRDDFDALIIAIGEFLGSMDLYVDRLRSGQPTGAHRVVSIDEQVVNLLRTVDSYLRWSLKTDARIVDGEPALHRSHAPQIDANLDALRVVGMILDRVDAGD